MRSLEVDIPKLNTSVVFLVGQSAQDNDTILQNAKSEDLWFHVNHKSSCHVIANTSDIIVPRKHMKYIIKQGAVLCKQYSYPSDKNLEIIYTRVKNIETTNIPGKVHTHETSIVTI